MQRRNFLKTTATIATGAALLPNSLSAAAKIITNDKIRIGVIGINGMGWSNLMAFLKHPEAECVAICDVDSNVISKREAELKKRDINVKTYTDYKQLLSNKDIDAVIIGTPDHWHCKMMVDSCIAGKDVYCEKPIGNSIAECEVMVNAQKKYNKVVQVGQWQRSQQHFADAIAFVHSGKLGNVRIVKAWAYQGWMGEIPVQPDGTPPAGVNYDMWLGPAEKRPFNPNRFHFNFRWYWDYAGGLMTDWGVHMIDFALIGQKVDFPKSIMASGGKFAYPDDAEQTPDTLTTVYDFGTFNLLWEHATGINQGPYARDHGVAFIGNKGTLVLNRNGWEVIPEVKNGKSLMEAVPLQAKVDNGLNLHTKNFLDVVKSRKMDDLKCSVKEAARTATICSMGNIAYRTGKKIYWDAAKNKFTDSEANQLLAAKYHNGYSLPKV